MSTFAWSNLKYFSQNRAGCPKKQPPTAQQSRTFTCFPKLPVEVRFEIWKLSAPDPRNIDIGIKYGNEHEPLCRYYTTHVRHIPRILHVNREARSVTLESYTLEYGLGRWPPTPGYTYFIGRLYVNWARDIICPINVHEIEFEDRTEIFEHPRIHNIALNVRELLDPHKQLRADGALNIPSLLGISNLEEIIFYYMDPPPERSAGRATRNFRMEFKNLDESVIVKDLCRMPLDDRPSLSYLLAARKTVYKDFDILVHKRKTRDELVEKGDEVPIELNINEIDRILDKKRPVVRLAYMTVGGKFSSS